MFASSSENSRENLIIQNCMIAKGYQLVDRNQIPNDSAVVDINSFENLKTKAESGDAEAQCHLAWCYANGQQVETNYVEAIKWWRESAAQNNARAQLNLGITYAKGEGVEKDDAEAVSWFRKAAAQNYADAQYILGIYYAEGDGVEKDQVEACRLLTLAVAQGFSRAYYPLSIATESDTPDDFNALVVL